MVSTAVYGTEAVSIFGAHWVVEPSVMHSIAQLWAFFIAIFRDNFWLIDRGDSQHSLRFAMRTFGAIFWCVAG